MIINHHLQYFIDHLKHYVSCVLVWPYIDVEDYVNDVQKDKELELYSRKPIPHQWQKDEYESSQKEYWIVEDCPFATIYLNSGEKILNFASNFLFLKSWSVFDQVYERPKEVCDQESQQYCNYAYLKDTWRFLCPLHTLNLNINCNTIIEIRYAD